MKRTNIMLTEEQHSLLSRLASKEGSTLGEKVREAIEHAYGMSDHLRRKRVVALRAYQEGFISIGKLSEVLGLDPVSTRNYLKGQNIKLQVQDKKELLQDVVNA